MSDSTRNVNIDRAEVSKFDEIAFRWWDKQSEFKPLHDINPLRLRYIQDHVSLHGKHVVDVGCGGGILSEALAQAGAQVTGIDMAQGAIEVAQLHRLESHVDVDYLLITAEELAAQRPGTYDVVTCMEMLEHVPDPASVIQACTRLVKPGGHVFFSSLNRNMKSYVQAIIGAEYVLGMLPKGTHDYRKFIRPSELAQWSRAAGLDLLDISGMSYNPITRHYALVRDVSVNYLATCQRSEQ